MARADLPSISVLLVENWPANPHKTFGLYLTSLPSLALYHLLSRLAPCHTHLNVGMFGEDAVPSMFNGVCVRILGLDPKVAI